MARDISIEWSGGEVPATVDGPEGASTGVVLAHGAGAGRSHPFMEGLRTRLAAAGFLVVAFDYPYMAAGRKAPDRLPTLVAAHEAAATHLEGLVDRAVIAGKSMGGRVGSHLSGFDQWPRLFYGYPLVALGKSEPRDTTHLDRLTGGLLFVQGGRDRMGPLDLLRPVVKRLDAALHVVPDADHSFKVPKRTGRTGEDVLDELVSVTREWIQGLGTW
ncbi:MAG TPA: alpha/beta family hydrolase [Acidimicrobiia bacterium]|nr:alpha/beta family hydrolase [Acidimicrobiia bacterium]